MQASTFNSQVVIVTGASSGIGKALSMQLAREGVCLSLAARDAQRLEKLAEECDLLGGNAIPVPTDVADEKQCQALVERTIDRFGRLDMLVNNAGFSLAGKFDRLPDLELFKRVMDVNFMGMVHCTYYALPYLKPTCGRIVNVSSLGGKFAIPYNTSYIASKFAMTGFSDSLRMELNREGVSVTVVFPYWVATEFHERLLDKDGQPRGEAGRALYTSRTMTADKCATIILKAAFRRKREVVMWPGSVGIWFKLIAPDLVDRFIVDKLFRPAAERSLKNEVLDGS